MCRGASVSISIVRVELVDSNALKSNEAKQEKMKMKQKSKKLRESATEIREGKACLINCKAQVQSKPISFERSSIDLRRAFSYSKIHILKL